MAERVFLLPFQCLPLIYTFYNFLSICWSPLDCKWGVGHYSGPTRATIATKLYTYVIHSLFKRDQTSHSLTQSKHYKTNIYKIHERIREKIIFNSTTNPMCILHIHQNWHLLHYFLAVFIFIIFSFSSSFSFFHFLALKEGLGCLRTKSLTALEQTTYLQHSSSGGHSTLDLICFSFSQQDLPMFLFCWLSPLRTFSVSSSV